MANHLKPDDIMSGKRPKQSGRKPFAIECRYAPECVEDRRRRGWSPYPFQSNNDWRVWRRYRDEKGRDRALENLRRKYSGPGTIRFEFRPATS